MDNSKLSMRSKPVRVASENDIRLIRTFFYDIFLDAGDYDLSHYRDSIKGSSSVYLEPYIVYNEDSIPIGVTGIYSDKREGCNECWLMWFGVREEFRRRGYATEMLRWTLDEMRNIGYKGCRLYTNRVINAESLFLYRKFGFKEDSIYFGDTITMKLPLVSGYIMKDWSGIPLEYVEECPIDK